MQVASPSVERPSKQSTHVAKIALECPNPPKITHVYYMSSSKIEFFFSFVFFLGANGKPPSADMPTK